MRNISAIVQRKRKEKKRKGKKRKTHPKIEGIVKPRRKLKWNQTNDASRQKFRKWTVVPITLINDNSRSPKKISLDSIIILSIFFLLLHIFVFFFKYFSSCVIYFCVSCTSGSDSFSLRTHIHATCARTRTLTHRHHHHPIRSSFRVPRLYVPTIMWLIIMSRIRLSFTFTFLFSPFPQISGRVARIQRSVDILRDTTVIFQASFGVCAQWQV